MALLKPILGSGRIRGNAIYMKPTMIVDDTEINIGFNIEIGFYSPSGEYVGSVSTSPDGAGYIDFEIEEERIGGLDKFEFSIGRDVDIPFYPLLECRFFISGVHWYTGELIFKPNQDRREIKYKYQGNGYYEYLKRIKMTKTYNNNTIDFILNDIIQNFVEPNSRIIYNPELIQPPNITVIGFEINKKDLLKTMDRILGICNYDYNNIQYVAGVDKNRHFYFLPIDDEVDYGFFEGYQYQDPDVKEDLKKVVNQVNIYRAKSGSSDIEYVTTVNDLDSQGRYGLKEHNLTIPIYLDTASAIKIAQFIIEKHKDPLVSASIKNLETLTEPYPIGFYHLNNKIDDYRKIIGEFEILSEWNLTVPNTTIATTTEKVLSGRQSFKCTTSVNSSGDYLEKTFDDEVNFPTYLDLWMAQTNAGTSIKLYIWTIEGQLITQNIEVLITNDFDRHRINVSSIDNIKRIRIEFITNESNVIYLDRLEIITRSWIRHNLILDKIKYKLNKSRLLADATFGNKVDTLVDKIKKIKDRQDDIFDIYEKL